MKWPRVNGRRYLGSCATYDEAANLAQMYGGVIEELGVRLFKDASGNSYYHSPMPGWFAVFIDRRPFADGGVFSQEVERGVTVSQPGPMFR